MCREKNKNQQKEEKAKIEMFMRKISLIVLTAAVAVFLTQKNHEKKVAQLIKENGALVEKNNELGTQLDKIVFQFEHHKRATLTKTRNKK